MKAKRAMARIGIVMIMLVMSILLISNIFAGESDLKVDKLRGEMIALSKDKEGVLELAQKGHIIDRVEDLVKNPYVLEFLGLGESHEYKIGKLTHKDLGQLQMYVNYYDRKVKGNDENPTIGILLCADKKEAIVRYTLPKDNEQIFASKYKLYLPDKKALEEKLKKVLGDNLALLNGLGDEFEN